MLFGTASERRILNRVSAGTRQTGGTNLVQNNTSPCIITSVFTSVRVVTVQNYSSCNTKSGEFGSDLAYRRADKHTEGRLEA